MGEVVRCGNCGKEIDNRKRCPYCGVEPGGPSLDEIFDQQAATRVQLAESQGQGAKIIMVLSGLVALVIGVAVALYFLGVNLPLPQPDADTPVADGPETARATTSAYPQAGSTDIEPDAVRFDPLLQRLNNDTEPGATAEEGATAPETPPAVDGELTEDQAIDRVAARPEVKAWMKQVHDREPNNKTMVRSVGLEMGRYTIHVYEDVNDGNGLGHSATFGWYEVDKKTGEVVKSEE